MRAISDMPAKTPRPMGRTESFFPGIPNAALVVVLVEAIAWLGATWNAVRVSKQQVQNTMRRLVPLGTRQVRHNKLLTEGRLVEDEDDIDSAWGEAGLGVGVGVEVVVPLVELEVDEVVMDMVATEVIKPVGALLEDD
jgi:hypothetical protein